MVTGQCDGAPATEHVLYGIAHTNLGLLLGLFLGQCVIMVSVMVLLRQNMYCTALLTLIEAYHGNLLGIY